MAPVSLLACITDTRAVFGRIAPFGASLCLASIGYGTLTTFITLYYLNRGWAGAAYCLTVFGVCFILSRLVFISAISRFGGFTAAIAWFFSPWACLAGTAFVVAVLYRREFHSEVLAVLRQG